MAATKHPNARANLGWLKAHFGAPLHATAHVQDEKV
jgi:hypothetical protein